MRRPRRVALNTTGGANVVLADSGMTFMQRRGGKRQPRRRGRVEWWACELQASKTWRSRARKRLQVHLPHLNVGAALCSAHTPAPFGCDARALDSTPRPRSLDRLRPLSTPKSDLAALTISCCRLLTVYQCNGATAAIAARVSPTERAPVAALPTQCRSVARARRSRIFMATLSPLPAMLAARRRWRYVLPAARPLQRRSAAARRRSAHRRCSSGGCCSTHRCCRPTRRSTPPPASARRERRRGGAV